MISTSVSPMTHSPSLPAPDESIGRTIDYWVATNLLASVDHQHSMGSTNSTALQWLREYRSASEVETAVLKKNLPRLVIADVQTSGRGRLGRTWDAPRDGLAFSLLLSGCHELLSLAIGVAIAETIEHVAAPAKCGLKWPNDVRMGDGKVAGILIERVDVAAGEGGLARPIAVIGIGVNVTACPTLADAETTSINQASGKWISRADLLAELIPVVIANVEKCETDRKSILDGFRNRCVLSGEVIRCVIDGQPVWGRCEGIDEQGELTVQTQSGRRTCRSGEVSRVRVV